MKFADSSRFHIKGQEKHQVWFTTNIERQTPENKNENFKASFDNGFSFMVIVVFVASYHTVYIPKTNSARCNFNKGGYSWNKQQELKETWEWRIEQQKKDFHHSNLPKFDNTLVTVPSMSSIFGRCFAALTETVKKQFGLWNEVCSCFDQDLLHSKPQWNVQLKTDQWGIHVVNAKMELKCNAMQNQLIGNHCSHNCQEVQCTWMWHVKEA